MDTPDFPCTVGFPFAFKEGELRRYYEGWDMLKYNEDVGELHRTDENGNRIKLRFATMLARKRPERCKFCKSRSVRHFLSGAAFKLCCRYHF